MVTAASPNGFRSRVPAKITSSMRAPRRLLADCSPSTQLMASLRFDLPQPLGPTIAAMPPPLKRSSVRSQLSEAAYGFAAGLFFLGYVLFEVPSNLLLTRIGARRTLSRIMVLWGLASASMMFVRTETSFY